MKRPVRGQALRAALWLDLVQGFLEHLRGLGRSPGTVVKIAGHLDRWLRFCRARGPERPAQTTPSHVAQYRVYLERISSRYGRRLSEVYQVALLDSLRSLLRWGFRTNRLLFDPTRDLKLKKPRPQARPFLTVPEVELLLTQPNPRAPEGLRDRAMLEVLYSAGLRARECCSLDLDDIDRGNETLRVRRGKGGKDRLLPLGRTLAGVLESYLERGRPRQARGDLAEPQALFLTNRGGTRMAPVQLSNRMRKYARQAGFQPPLPTPHTLRHACATHLLENGADLLEIRAFLGHASVVSTQRYTRVFPGELLREYRRTHPREPGQRAGSSDSRNRPPAEPEVDPR